jgi:histidine phosphotransferase ChpT
MSDDLEFSALLASHLCHELVGPIGAIVNGLEVLEESDDDAEMRGQALGLLGNSAAEASARLQYYRLAYGLAAGLGAEVALHEPARLAAEHFSRTKVRLSWEPPPAMVPKAVARLVLNLLIVAAEALPRGGRISADLVPGTSLVVTAEGDMVRLSEQAALALEGKAEISRLEPRSATAWLAGSLARGIGAGLSVELGQNRLVLSAPLA